MNFAGASPGTLSIDGNLVLGPDSQITAELSGLNQGIDYDLIAVNGSAQLGGTLELVYSGGFNAAPGSAFDLITYASASGDFSAVLAPLGVVFSAGDFGSFFQFSIPQPPETVIPVIPVNALDPEFGIDPVIGTLPEQVIDPGDLIEWPNVDAEVELPDGKAQTKCN